MTSLINFKTSLAEICLWLPPSGFTSLAGIKGNHLYYWTNACTQSMGDYPYSIVLPPGEWEYIAPAFEATEEQWSEIVPFLLSIDGNIFMDYNHGDFEPAYSFDNERHSGHSILSHLGITKEDRTILLKKK